MSWVQENKFIAGLGVATVVLAGGLLYMGSAAADEHSAVVKKLKRAKSSVVRMKSHSPYPNQDAQALTRKSVNAFTEKARATQAEILSLVGKYNPAGESSSVFNEELLKFRTGLTELFKSKGIGLPDLEGVYFGFDTYRSGGGIKAEDKSRLVYQRDALYWLMSKLVEAQPVRLVNVHRPLLKEEEDEVVEVKPDRSRRRFSRNSAREEKQSIDVVDNLPVEVSFVGSEDSLRAFLESISNEGMTAEGYPFCVRAIRVMSELQSSPVIEAAESTRPAEVGVDDFSIDIEDVTPDGSIASGATGVIDPIIEPVAGFELLHIRLLLDLQLYKPAKDVDIPVQKKRDTQSDVSHEGEKQ